VLYRAGDQHCHVSMGAFSFGRDIHKCHVRLFRVLGTDDRDVYLPLLDYLSPKDQAVGSLYPIFHRDILLLEGGQLEGFCGLGRRMGKPNTWIH